jgi:hypothetical protein
LQANDFFIILTHKERNRVVHKAMWFKWEMKVIPSYTCMHMHECELCFIHNNMKTFYNIFMKS